jgi:hypothetical protein
MNVGLSWSEPADYLTPLLVLRGLLRPCPGATGGGGGGEGRCVAVEALTGATAQDPGRQPDRPDRTRPGREPGTGPGARGGRLPGAAVVRAAGQQLPDRGTAAGEREDLGRGLDARRF